LDLSVPILPGMRLGCRPVLQLGTGIALRGESRPSKTACNSCVGAIIRQDYIS
jgi:hypothetical protein